MKILKFYADWCGPCKLLDQTLAEFDNLPSIEVIDISAPDLNRELIDRYAVRGVPTMIKLSDANEELGRLVGVSSNKDLMKFLELE